MVNRQTRPKLAVVGTGAAAIGVLTALLDKQSDFDIVIYDIGKQVAEISPPDEPSEEWIISFYNKIYKEIRSLYPLKFPPPKTHLAEQISRHPFGQRLNIFKSETFGGLTNYWGGTMLPLTDREMKQWPISKEALYPYYQKIAQIIGLAARDDALNEYFIRDFSTRPPISPTLILDRLDQMVNRQPDKEQFRIISGLNRCALETRPDQPNHCLYCGECLAGCFRDAIYSTRFSIKEYLKNPLVKYLKGKVIRVIKKSHSLEVKTDNGLSESGFSKVFLCAGCPASTEIVLRSLNLRNRLTIADNAVYVFPIFYLGRKLPQASDKSYLSLCNIIFGCVPKKEDEHFAQVQIYPNFDYLWRYNILPKLWPIIKLFLSPFWSRIFWARLYVHSNYSQAYSFELKDNQLILNQIRQAKTNNHLRTLLSSIRTAVNHQGFYIPPIPPIRQRVNSHYAATLPFGGKLVEVSSSGEVMPNVYLCDSACFPELPAINPGFTIMANACRIADQALD